jgi:hypothetical protein
METRIELAKSKGFDAVEPDNIDGWENETGFNITATEQLTYNEWIASAVHAAGMSVVLKNDIDQAQTLEPYFDWDLDEQAYQNDEWSPGLLCFVNAGKAVFEAEYSGYVGDATPQATAMNALHINSTTYDLNLVSPSTSGYIRIPCIPDDQNTWMNSVGNNYPSLAITTAAIPNAIGGTPFCQSLSASGSTGDYTWTIVDGILPDNFTLSSEGVIRGETVHAYPPSSHTYTFTVQATDAANNTASRTLSITVNCPRWDIKGDGICNVEDLTLLGLYWNETCPPAGSLKVSMKTELLIYRMCRFWRNIGIRHGKGTLSLDFCQQCLARVG